MADISIEQEKAKQWMADVKNELELVEALLKTVTAASTTVPGDDDVIMQGVEKTCETLTQFWNTMCEGFKSASSLLEEAINKIGQVADEVIEDINTVRGKIGS
jgi:archaellum component FlaC